MKIGRIPTILIASTLSIIALVIIQYSWVQHSKKLMEEAFDNRVCTALCSTVEGYYGVPTCKDSSACALNSGLENKSNCLNMDPKDENAALLGSMAHALEFYDINLDFTFSFSNSKLSDNKPSNIYQFPIKNTTETNARFVNVIFPERANYFFGQSRFMLLSSILVLVFISFVFFLANWLLWRQKRQTEINVDFFNNTAHEFRTPLTNILLASKMISRKNHLSEDNRFLQIIRRESKKLLNQSEKVLYLARLENGEYQLNKETTKLKQILEETLNDIDMQIQDRQATINLTIPSDVTIFGDKIHLGNVFRNLLDNAMKYNRNKPEIDVSAKSTQKGVLITFKDNGVGISKSDQEYIFNKFQRVSEGNNHNRKGFGLGLTYVKMITELHNGSIKVTSNLNEGSRFSLFLPTGINGHKTIHKKASSSI